MRILCWLQCALSWCLTTEPTDGHSWRVYQGGIVRDIKTEWVCERCGKVLQS